MRPMERPLFSRTGSITPARSVFDLSHSKLFDCDMTQLIPILCDEMVPGDIFEIANEMVLRMQPMLAPMLHEVNIYVHYFFVPYRIMWANWEPFITGGFDGANADTLPRWTPTNTAKGSLWDFLGFPVGVNPTGALPMDFPRIAYNRIYNEYYRDETLVTAVAETNETILKRAMSKDYFTSALPWRQRGTAPALPISGLANIYQGASTVTSTLNQIGGPDQVYTVTQKAYAAAGTIYPAQANLAVATTFNVTDLRVAFQIQRWLERNARAGARYTEWLKAHYGVAPKDERLQRPEYIGGSKSPVIVSEVLQTSATSITGGSTPQGYMAGHGISVDKNYVSKYKAEEFGLIMGIMSVMPVPAYCQGINRQWLRTTRYDFYTPEYANLSEQAIIRAEIYADGSSTNNNTIFGYQGRYDEMRYKPSYFMNDMRDTLNYWHMGRIFTGAPLLNQSFIEMDGTAVANKRPFQAQNVPELIVHFGNRIKGIRPMPVMAVPGLIDHDNW